MPPLPQHFHASRLPSNLASYPASTGLGCRNMNPRTLRVTLNGTGFAADYTAACYGLIPHRNGVVIEMAGVTSGRLERAEAFARSRGIAPPYATHAEMLATIHPDNDNVCCANDAHGPYG